MAESTAETAQKLIDFEEYITERDQLKAETKKLKQATKQAKQELKFLDAHTHHCQNNYVKKQIKAENMKKRVKQVRMAKPLASQEDYLQTLLHYLWAVNQATEESKTAN